MRKFISQIFVLAISYNLIQAQAPSKDLQITHIANEGFMLKTLHHKIFVDALFSYEYGYFEKPSPEVINQIISTTAPFDSVDLCFITHYHQDHSDSKLISGYLAKNPTVKLVTTKPSLVFIDGEQFGFVKLKKQFCEFTPETNKSTSATINDVPVKAYGLKHMSFYQDGIDVEEYMFNVGYYINLDGIRIFHSGDTNMDNYKVYVSANGSWKDPVDVAFVNYEMLHEGKSDLDYLVRTMNPRYIAVMHVPPSLHDEWLAKIKILKPSFSNMILFKNSLESQTIEF